MSAPRAVDELFPLVYDELRRLADVYLGRERKGHTLQPTALVHETFIKLLGQTTVGWSDRAAFFGVAAVAMRRILVDHARRHRAAKRGGGAGRIALDEGMAVLEERAIDIVALDEALVKLARLDPGLCHVVELRFFGGLTEAQAAEVLGVSERTVRRDWVTARAWLRGKLEIEAPE